MCVANTGPVSLAVQCYTATSQGLQQCAGWLAFLGKGRWGWAGALAPSPVSTEWPVALGGLGKLSCPPLWGTGPTARGAGHWGPGSWSSGGSGARGPGKAGLQGGAWLLLSGLRHLDGLLIGRGGRLRGVQAVGWRSWSRAPALRRAGVTAYRVGTAGTVGCRDPGWGLWGIEAWPSPVPCHPCRWVSHQERCASTHRSQCCVLGCHCPQEWLSGRKAQVRRQGVAACVHASGGRQNPGHSWPRLHRAAAGGQ